MPKIILIDKEKSLGNSKDYETVKKYRESVSTNYTVPICCQFIIKG